VLAAEAALAGFPMPTIESHAALRAAALASPDYAEGVSAFLERRSPRFG
jgi:enoyl-CoA hydratase/carnithine racemase